MLIMVVGSTFLILWLALCIAVVRFDVEDALWRLMALLMNFLILTAAFPRVLDLGLCYECWRTAVTSKPSLSVLGALFLSVLFIFEIARMIDIAKEGRAAVRQGE